MRGAIHPRMEEVRRPAIKAVEIAPREPTRRKERFKRVIWRRIENILS